MAVLHGLELSLVYGSGLAPVGDVNGDGRADLAILEPGGQFGLGSLRVFAGGSGIPLFSAGVVAGTSGCR